MKFTPATPILRSFDEKSAREFYLDFLGFEVQFEHRFEADLPLYFGIRLGEAELHISEHHGDATPGARVRVGCEDLTEYCRQLQAKQYKGARPGGPSPTPWGTLEMTVPDPSGNKLTFWQIGTG